MELKGNIGLILIIIGLLISLTMVGAWVGVPLAAIGVYILNKKVKKQEENLSEELQAKKDEIDNIDEKLKQMEKDKEEEINQKLAAKQKELEGIDDTYKRLEESKNNELNLKLKEKRDEINKLDQEVKLLQKELDLAKDESEMQVYGLYEPRYNFIDSVSYKERLDAIRKQQKQMIKDKTAAIGATDWTIDGSKSKGKAFINANIKQILRSFNNETEVIINKVKHSNLESSEKRIKKSFDTLNNLYSREKVHITQGYLNLKLDEMYLAYEYEAKKQEEKEILAEAREREREEKKLQKKLEKEKNKFNKENDRINDELEKAKAEMQSANDKEKAKLEAEIAKLKAALKKNNEEIEKIDEWKETPGAGYVYIISNIGSFGEDVFKIGVTRRDDPEERIRELSNASVPFKYDSHVFIFSKDAYTLESNLHERFDNKRVNKINRRKEFFNITIDDVKKIVEENKASVHSFVEKPEAEEYYDSLKLSEMQ